MPLTPSEKMKRYRERLRQNPEKYEVQRKKNLDRIKSKYKYKKISDMEESEKDMQRKMWKERKRNQKLKKKTQTKERTNKTHEIDEELQYCQEPTSSEMITTGDQHVMEIERKLNQTRISRNRLRRQLTFVQSRVVYMERRVEALRKKMTRIEKAHKEEKKKIEDALNKTLARNEVLEASLKMTYQSCETNTERNLFKKIVSNETVKSNKSVKSFSKAMGLKERVRITKPKCRISKIKSSIIAFYHRDDVSRATSGKRECKTLKKNKQQIRYLTNSLKILHEQYRSEGGPASFTSFCKYKPFYILSPSLNNRNTCLCVKHSNMTFKVAALKRNNVLNLNNTHELLKKLVCDIHSFECMYGKCDKCETRLHYNLDNNKSSQEITWQMWEVKEHTYKKLVNNVEQELKTKKTVKTLKTGTVAELIKVLEADVKLFKVHSYNMWHQTKNYNKCIEDLDETEIAIHCDFSENYECKMSEEIQAMHFGSSKNQVTLHTGVLFFKGGKKSFCTVSPSNIHQPHAIWAHINPIIELGKSLVPNLRKIHFFSDGPSSQYKQKKNFYLIRYFSSYYKVDITWSFFESGHGKGVADAIGGVVKRTLDRQVTYGTDIVDARDVHLTLNKFAKAVSVIYVSEFDINAINQLIPNGLKTIKGTMTIHQVMSTRDNDEIKHRILSCFCTKMTCACYDPVTHKYDNMSKIDDKKGNNEFHLDQERISPSLANMPFPNEIELEMVDNMLRNVDNTLLQHIDVDMEDDLPAEDTKNAAFDCMDVAGEVIVLSSPIEFISEKNNTISSDAKLHLNENKENFSYPSKKENKCKSIKIPVTRQITCSKCKKPCTLQDIVKCMSCKKYYCSVCTEGQLYFDYICNICFGDE